MKKLSNALTACLVASTSVLTGCAVMGGDMPVRVIGAVPAPPRAQLKPICRLDLVQADTGKTRSNRQVTGEFSESFVIEARAKSYYFVVTCDNGREFRSEDYKLGSRGSFNKLIDLGAIDEVQP